MDATTILQRVVKGKLQAYSKVHDVRLGLLLFDRRDLEKCVDDVKTEHSWISREDVKKLLKVKDGTLTRWMKVGLLSPSTICAHVQYFSKPIIDQFIADCITSEEAAQILSIGMLAVQRWARTGRLSEACISGPNVDGYHSYLFHKEKLIQWRQERLTFGEAAKLLDVSKSTLHRWTAEGKIKPLHDMEGKQRWFLRIDAELLLRKV